MRIGIKFKRLYRKLLSWLRAQPRDLTDRKPPCIDLERHQGRAVCTWNGKLNPRCMLCAEYEPGEEFTTEGTEDTERGIRTTV